MVHRTIDPRRRIARVGAGALWSDVIEAAAAYGLAVPDLWVRRGQCGCRRCGDDLFGHANHHIPPAGDEEER